MKTKLRNIALSALILLFILATYLCGYYRGSQDSSLKGVSWLIAVNEALYDDLQKSRIDAAKRTLQVVISGDSQSLKTMQQNPLGYFVYEVTGARAGDIPAQIKKADEIAKTITPPSSVPSTSASPP
jgi:hypothetical protein